MGEATLTRFAAKNHMFNRSSHAVVFDGGFVQFVRRGELDGFLGVKERNA